METTIVKIIFYSMYGHVYRLAKAVAEGSKSVPKMEVHLLQVPELVPEEILEKSGAKKARQEFADIPIAKVSDLKESDAIIIGAPTRYGTVCAQMRNFWDQTGSLWMKHELEGKVGSVFSSTATQHGGQETTITSFYPTLIHHGMVVVGVPYSEEGLFNIEEVSGGSPYGATTISGNNTRMPSENELKIARFQGAHVARVAKALKIGFASI